MVSSGSDSSQSRRSRRLVGWNEGPDSLGWGSKRARAGRGEADMSRIDSRRDSRHRSPSGGGARQWEESEGAGFGEEGSRKEVLGKGHWGGGGMKGGENESESSQDESDSESESEEIPGEEVEVKSATDDAWYEAKLSVIQQPSGAPRLLVNFFQFVDDKEILDEPGHDMLRRVRFLSKPMRNDHCGKVRLGEVVCAFKVNAADNSLMWFDAKVCSACPNHFDGACHCSYSIRWIHGPSRGEREWVSPSSVCKRSGRDVRRHSHVRKYLREWNKWYLTTGGRGGGGCGALGTLDLSGQS